VAGTISKALRSEPDVLVRQWLAIAAAGYIDFELVFNSISERLLDGKEDMDVRYNCLASLEELGPTKKVLAVYEMLRNRPSPMSDTVKRHLNEWSTAKHKR